MPTSRPNLLRAALVLTCLAALALPAAAQWKWRDKAGQITASDLPPPRDIAEKDILQRPDLVLRRASVMPTAAASAASAPQRALVDKDLEAKRRASELEEAAKTRAEEERQIARRADNCKRARAHASDLQSGQRMVRTSDKGEREVMDDRARAEELRRANEVIASDCR